MARNVKVSVLLEFELATECDDADLVSELYTYFRKPFRPEWKGLNFVGALPGTLAGGKTSVLATIGHGVYGTIPPARKPRPKR